MFLLIGYFVEGDTTGNGQSFRLVVEGFKKSRIPLKVINLTQRKNKDAIGSFNIVHAIFLLRDVCKIWLNLPFAKGIYITVSISTWGFLRDLLTILPAKLLHKRVVIHVHSGGFGLFYESQNNFFQFLIKRTLSSVDKIIILGDLLLPQFNFLPSTQMCKFETVPYGLPLHLNVNNIKPKKRKPKSRIKILYLSNLIRSKGYLELLEACWILKNNGVDFECNFCGEFISTIHDLNQKGYDKTSFISRINELNLTDSVNYIGPVFGAQKQEMLQNSNILVLPTFYPWEGQPICIIEALAFGLPVIATRYRGIPEEVIDGYNGFLIDSRDPNLIAEAIKKLYLDDQLYSEMSSNAIKHYEQNFTQRAHLNRIVPVITGKNWETNDNDY